MANSNPEEERAGPAKGDFIAPPEEDEQDERGDALPMQEEFWRPPVRFGSVPVEKEPLGWDRRRGFRKHFPLVSLPTQVVERVSFGHPELEPNRLFWGDNLHVMRQLPSESIDLIYIDPPFFSGRQYNVIFGDQNELRSFSDIWEGGMPGYLIWLNARLYEMKRLLNQTGSIYVHCDWHASHYIKVEMDKIFGHENLRNEIIWCYRGGGVPQNDFAKKHDVILRYSKSSEYKFCVDSVRIPYSEDVRKSDASRYDKTYRANKTYEGYRPNEKGKHPEDWWLIQKLMPSDKTEQIGYPTQKPIELLQRIIEASSEPGDTVADFFSGGGSFAAVAQGLRVNRETRVVKKRDGSEGTKEKLVYFPVAEQRRWIACDQSRVAVAITLDRLTHQVQDRMGGIFGVPDFTLEHWGVYEAQRLSNAPADQFRAFVLRCFGARDEEQIEGIHGYKGAIPVWVGEPDQKNAATAEDVQAFANAIRKSLRYKQDNLRDGFMLAWAFRPDATEAANRLRWLENTDLNFIRLDMIRIDSPLFREHVAALSTEHADYENFLTFVQPPRVEVGFRRSGRLTYAFDASESIVMNSGAKIINVQWDFDYEERFSSTPKYSFVRKGQGKKEPVLQVQFTFAKKGMKWIACRVQDDMGGEGLWTAEIEVE